ncbi:MAG TPA: bifunctional ADP-dependent NAD(P)H-hydrate dehydratase/NAD(P)H-hydrate epimerase, partial [Candidatus Binatia bacterium]|nr:bifunctional ADP-dependent NAD(P)H-hydrate dehydratase/NAD(P)H-hydrate epimerase [Candidatus Binatia bacterium]
GILAALLAQGLSSEEAMKLAVYLHGFIADRIAAKRGMLGMIASDIIDGLPAGLRTLSDAV